ncbi:MAG: phosphohydrolase [Blastochloris sp.]|nr:phosphohydrolase [Blastochloris sp.]
MKLLIVSDLHYHLHQYDWMLAEAPHYDAVIVAGDLLDLGSSVQQDIQMVVVERYLQKIQKLRPVLTASGNHDFGSQAGEGLGSAAAFWMEALEDVGVPSDGHCVSLGDGAKVSLCRWWQDERERDQVYAQLLRDREQAGEKWFWVHHVPPDGTPLSWTGKKHMGEAILNDWILELQPDLVFCGHIHRAPFTSEGSWQIQLGKTRGVQHGSGNESRACPFDN